MRRPWPSPRRKTVGSGALLVDIKPDQWSLPTDCTRWDVRAIVVHLIASAEAQASAVEFVRQAVVGSRLTKQIGGITPVDGLNEAGLRARRHLTPAELPAMELSRREGAACPASNAQTDPGAAAPQAGTEVLGSRSATSTTSALPVMCGCTESTSAAPLAAPSTQRQPMTGASSPTSSPNGPPPPRPLHPQPHRDHPRAPASPGAAPPGDRQGGGRPRRLPHPPRRPRPRRPSSLLL